MNKHIIYEFVSPSDKRYIGRTSRPFRERLAEHKYLSNTVDGKWKLYDAIGKYGWDNFEKNIIEKVDTEEKAIERERYYIEKYDAVENGYNIDYDTSTGGDTLTRIKDEEPERFEELRKQFASYGMEGKSHSEESKQKMKEQAKGRFSLPWYINKYGEKEGRKKYKERCERLSERNMERNENGQFT